MSSIKRLPVILLLLLFESACTSTTVDSDVMINRLLHIDNEKFMSTTDGGESFYNSLMEYKEWESLYIKYSKYDSEDKNLTEAEVKKLLFIGYTNQSEIKDTLSFYFRKDIH